MANYQNIFLKNFIENFNLDSYTSIPKDNSEFLDGVYISNIKDYISQDIPIEVSDLNIDDFSQKIENEFYTFHKSYRIKQKLINIKDNLTVDLPLVLDWQTKSIPIFYNIIKIGKNSNVKILELNLQNSNFLFPFTDVVLDENSRCDFISWQDHSSETTFFYFLRFFLNKDSNLKFLNIRFGSKKSIENIHFYLDGRGANCQILGSYFLNKNQDFEIYTLQEHNGENSSSNLLFKNVLKQQAKAKFMGIVKINRTAKNADAFQDNPNLLLSPTAKLESIPILEIESKEVRCKHSSTASSIREDEKFYVLSRGLPHQEAERLIAEGFILSHSESFLEKFENGLKEKFSKKIQEKVNA